MAHNRTKKKKAKSNNGSHDILGVTLIVISAFLLLCIVIKPILGVFSEAIFNVLLGVFGIASYPILIALLILGIFLLGGRSVQAEVKTRVGIALAVIFALIILQLASTHAFLSGGFADYIDSVYSCKYSVGGIIVGIVAYGIQALISEVAAYIIFSLALILDILFMTSAISRLRGAIQNKKPKAVEQPEPAPEPAVPQMVVDATPAPGLFTGTIERNAPEISVETGSASDIPISTQRKVSDYSEKPVFEEEQPIDHTAASAAARVRLYSDKEEIMRRAAEEFRASVAQKPQAVTPEPEPAPEPEPENIEPALRVASDAHNIERPRRVDYEGTPGNLNALYFPPDKNIHFNDVGIETIVDEHPRTVVPEQDPSRAPIYDGTDVYRPAFGMPKTGTKTEYVQPIIDASQPITVTPPEPVYSEPKISEPVVQPAARAAEDFFLNTQEPEPVIDGSEPLQNYVPPLETEKFREDDIFDASDEINNIGIRGDALQQEQEDILDGSAPFDAGKFGQSDIEEIGPIFDDGILDGLRISDEPAIDLSEKNFDNGDVFTGRDMSGMYVSVDDEKPAAQPAKPAKTRKSNAPLENQLTIDGMLQEKANESVAIQDTKKYKQYNYKTPPYDLLKIYEKVDSSEDELNSNAKTLEDVVSRFLKTQVNVINIVPGPQVTRYELEVPSGYSVKSIESRSADIAYELAAVGGVRVEAPIPGKRAVGIEVPNKSKAIVGLREVVDSPIFVKHKSPMLFSVGKDIGGELVVCDLEKIPHLLIAGQTGSGKSAGLNSLIVSLLYKSSPDNLRFLLIDPKRVEFSKFRGMPHLLFEKTITEPNEALNALKWADNEMNRRYTVLQKYACSKLSEYNSLPDVRSGKISKLPHIVIIIDELANLMQSAVSGEIESKISSIAALARAAGIHLIVATQRPSADVITGTIKANLTSRIAFKVPDAMNSRIIIDVLGAESLTGDGDMLFYPQDAYAPRRVQGSYVGGEEVLAVVNYLKEHYECDFDEDAERFVSGGSGGGAMGGDGGGELDPLAARVMSHAIKSKQISTSVVQRRFSIGYARAARIIDSMEAPGYIGPSTGNNKPRDVLMTVEQYKEVFGHDLLDN